MAKIDVKLFGGVDGDQVQLVDDFVDLAEGDACPICEATHSFDELSGLEHRILYDDKDNDIDVLYCDQCEAYGQP